MRSLHATGIVEILVSAPFESVRQAVEQRNADRGMTLFARIDHAAGAERAGFAMKPTQLLIFGNAAAGTPVMLTAPLTALDLPLRLLIRETGEKETAIAYRPIGATLSALGVDAARLAKLEAAQKMVAEG